MSADKMESQLDQVPNTEKHGKHFSDDSFWDKVKGFASNVGAQGIYYALILYYTLMDDETPMTQKGIIIGHKGVALKQVGIGARKSLQDFFGKKIHLELYVKVSKNWRSSVKQLKRFGYNN